MLGAYVLDRDTGDITTVSAGATVLATGGAGKVYLYTTNPDVATGDGVAMAYRAGADIANMEFFQFHPTCLFHPQAKSFLISEALRGEGGILRNADGEAFMARYDPRKELAPRDIVARAIDSEMKRRGDDCAFLDITHRRRASSSSTSRTSTRPAWSSASTWPRSRSRSCRRRTTMCGGIATDLHGRTSIPRPLRDRRVACTGLHGANRLASNSLLEGLVFGHRAALHAVDDLAEGSGPPPRRPGLGPGRRARAARRASSSRRTGTSSAG